MEHHPSHAGDTSEHVNVGFGATKLVLESRPAPRPCAVLAQAMAIYLWLLPACQDSATFDGASRCMQLLQSRTMFPWIARDSLSTLACS